MVGSSRQVALALLLGYSSAASGATAGVAGTNPHPASPLATRVGSTTEQPAAAVSVSLPLREQLVQHERSEQHERPSFAKSWVTRARGGGSRVTADGGAGKEERGLGNGAGAGGGKDEVELALVGNFPNRCEATAAAVLLYC